MKTEGEEEDTTTTLSVEAAAAAIVASAAVSEFSSQPPSPETTATTIIAAAVVAPNVPSNNSNDHNHQEDLIHNWKAQFIKLNEKWVNDSSGKQSGTYLCVCRHCQGQKIPFTGRYCRNHLKACPVYQTTSSVQSAPIMIMPHHMVATSSSSSTAAAMKRKAIMIQQPSVGKKSVKPKQAALTPDAIQQGQQKFMEILAVAHRIPKEPQLLVDLCKFLRPDFVPPERSHLSIRAQEAHTYLSTQLKARIMEGHPLGCLIRPGENSLGGMLVAGLSYLLVPIPQTTTEKDGIELTRMVETFVLSRRHHHQVRFVTLPESRVRRILSARHPNLIWIPCLERHLTLLVRDAVLLVNDNFIDRLVSITTNETVDTRALYGKHVPLLPLLANDWGTLQGWLASKLRIQGAYQHHNHQQQQQHNVPPQQYTKLDYWEDLAAIERVVRPFCLAKYYLEDHPSLSSTVLILIAIYSDLWSLGSEISRTIAEHVEQLWSRLEQPLYFLALALHPSYSKTAKRILDESLDKNGSWRTKKNPLTIYRLMQATQFYHTKFQLPGSGETLVADLQLWLNHDLPKLAMIEYRPNDDPVYYWLRNKAEIPELANFAVLLLGTRAHSNPSTSSSNNKSCYYHSLIELDVMHHRSNEREETRPQRIVSPTALICVPTDANSTVPDDDSTSSSMTFHNIASSDTFEELWRNMKSYFDGREKISTTTVQPPVLGDTTLVDEKEEDGPEMWTDQLLAPLPNLDMGIGEENAAYFNTKVYCRNDKYPLQQFLSVFPKDLTINIWKEYAKDEGEYTE